MEKRSANSRTLINLLLSIFATIWVFPVIFTLLGSVKTKQEYNMGNFWDWPKSFHLVENIKNINGRINLMDGMLNSLLYAFTGAVLCVIISLLAAYAISHLEIKFRMFWFLLIYSGTIFPFQIYLIPVYKGYSYTGLYDTRFGMVLFYTAICVPFAMFVFRNFFIGISKEICESAKIDGASDLSVLINIFVPMSVAPISVVFLSQFNWIWNELMFGLTFTKSPEIRPVMAAVSLVGKSSIPEVLCACIIASLPTIGLFMLLQKNFESGYAYQGK